VFHNTVNIKLLFSCKQVIHRRLAVRNVLLKQQVNGLVAKLIGFGATAEDEGSGAAGTGVCIKRSD
jgi:hypothetical protein